MQVKLVSTSKRLRNNLENLIFSKQRASLAADLPSFVIHVARAHRAVLSPLLQSSRDLILRVS
jgi:hypothetical protein